MRFSVVILVFLTISSFQKKSEGKVLNTDEEIEQLLDYYSDTNNVFKDFGRDYEYESMRRGGRSFHTNRSLWWHSDTYIYDKLGVEVKYFKNAYRKSISITLNEKSTFLVKGLLSGKSKFKNIPILDSVYCYSIINGNYNYSVGVYSKFANYKTKRISIPRFLILSSLLEQDRDNKVFKKIRNKKINKIILHKDIN